MPNIIERRTWEEFREAGLLWWVNRILHIFGWAICYDYEGPVVEVYPAHCRFRGFSEDSETRGHLRLTEHIVADLGRMSSELPSLVVKLRAEPEDVPRG